MPASVIVENISDLDRRINELYQLQFTSMVKCIRNSKTVLYFQRIRDKSTHLKTDCNNRFIRNQRAVSIRAAGGHGDRYTDSDSL